MTSKQQIRFKQTEIGIIPQEWKTMRVEQIKAPIHNAIAIGPFGSRMKSNLYTASGVPIIRGNNISKTRAFVGDFVHVSEETADELRTSNAFADDLVFPHRGLIGNVAIVPNNGAKRYMLSTAMMKLTCNKMLVDPLFLFYFFRSATGRKQLLKNESTVGVPGIGTPLTSLKAIEVPVPTLEEQHAIAKSLSDLDSKIELNERMNKTLEEIGKAIFKHWFIDLEFPNEEGTPYKSSGGKMVYNQELKKEIPTGWSYPKIGEALKLVLGGTPDTYNKSYWENGTVPWINSGKINELRIIEPTTYITEEAVENSVTKLLPNRTTVIAITGATLGQVSRVEIETCANQSVIGIIESEAITSEYIYFWMKHAITEIIRQQTGAAQQHINRNNVAEARIMIPTAKVIKDYQKIIRPIFDKISLACFEIRTLTLIRDSLLPKLMSGKIVVPIEVT